MTTLDIRKAAPAAGPRFRALALEALGAGAAGFLTPAWLTRDHRSLWVAADASGPAGFLVTEQVGDCLEIHAIAVLPERRRHGLAAAMVRAACAEGLERGADRALLEVRADNQPALGLYARLGFRSVGVRRRYYSDGADAKLLEGSCRIPRE